MIAVLKYIIPNPITYGGGHEIDNLKLAHLFCNNDRDQVRKKADAKKWKALNAQLKELFK